MSVLKFFTAVPRQICKSIVLKLFGPYLESLDSDQITLVGSEAKISYLRLNLPTVNKILQESIPLELIEGKIESLELPYSRLLMAERKKIVISGVNLSFRTLQSSRNHVDVTEILFQICKGIGQIIENKFFSDPEALEKLLSKEDQQRIDSFFVKLDIEVKDVTIHLQVPKRAVVSTSTSRRRRPNVYYEFVATCPSIKYTDQLPSDLLQVHNEIQTCIVEIDRTEVSLQGVEIMWIGKSKVEIRLDFDQTKIFNIIDIGKIHCGLNPSDLHLLFDIQKEYERIFLGDQGKRDLSSSDPGSPFSPSTLSPSESLSISKFISQSRFKEKEQLFDITIHFKRVSTNIYYERSRKMKGEEEEDVNYLNLDFESIKVHKNKEHSLDISLHNFSVQEVVNKERTIMFESLKKFYKYLDRDYDGVTKKMERVMYGKDIPFIKVEFRRLGLINVFFNGLSKLNLNLGVFKRIAPLLPLNNKKKNNYNEEEEEGEEDNNSNDDLYEVQEYHHGEKEEEREGENNKKYTFSLNRLILSMEVPDDPLERTYELRISEIRINSFVTTEGRVIITPTSPSSSEDIMIRKKRNNGRRPSPLLLFTSSKKKKDIATRMVRVIDNKIEQVEFLLSSSSSNKNKNNSSDKKKKRVSWEPIFDIKDIEVNLLFFLSNPLLDILSVDPNSKKKTDLGIFIRTKNSLILSLTTTRIKSLIYFQKNCFLHLSSISAANKQLKPVSTTSSSTRRKGRKKSSNQVVNIQISMPSFVYRFGVNMKDYQMLFKKVRFEGNYYISNESTEINLISNLRSESVQYNLIGRFSKEENQRENLNVEILKSSPKIVKEFRKTGSSFISIDMNYSWKKLFLDGRGNLLFGYAPEDEIVKMKMVINGLQFHFARNSKNDDWYGIVDLLQFIDSFTRGISSGGEGGRVSPQPNNHSAGVSSASASSLPLFYFDIEIYDSLLDIFGNSFIFSFEECRVRNSYRQLSTSVSSNRRRRDVEGELKSPVGVMQMFIKISMNDIYLLYNHDQFLKLKDHQQQKQQQEQEDYSPLFPPNSSSNKEKESEQEDMFLKQFETSKMKDYIAFLVNKGFTKIGTFSKSKLNMLVYFPQQQQKIPFFSSDNNIFEKPRIEINTENGEGLFCLILTPRKVIELNSFVKYVLVNSIFHIPGVINEVKKKKRKKIKEEEEEETFLEVEEDWELFNDISSPEEELKGKVFVNEYRIVEEYFPSREDISTLNYYQPPPEFFFSSPRLPKIKSRSKMEIIIRLPKILIRSYKKSDKNNTSSSPPQQKKKNVLKFSKKYLELVFSDLFIQTLMLKKRYSEEGRPDENKSRIVCSLGDIFVKNYKNEVIFQKIEKNKKSNILGFCLEQVENSKFRIFVDSVPLFHLNLSLVTRNLLKDFIISVIRDKEEMKNESTLVTRTDHQDGIVMIDNSKSDDERKIIVESFMIHRFDFYLSLESEYNLKFREVPIKFNQFLASKFSSKDDGKKKKSLEEAMGDCIKHYGRQFSNQQMIMFLLYTTPIRRIKNVTNKSYDLIRIPLSFFWSDNKQPNWRNGDNHTNNNNREDESVLWSVKSLFSTGIAELAGGTSDILNIINTEENEMESDSDFSSNNNVYNLHGGHQMNRRSGEEKREVDTIGGGFQEGYLAILDSHREVCEIILAVPKERTVLSVVKIIPIGVWSTFKGTVKAIQKVFQGIEGHYKGGDIDETLD